MAKKTGSSKRWLSRHAKDTYVEAAKNSGFRSRASYKLIQVQEKYGVLGAGQTVVDLGAAPGGFSQVARDLVGEKGSVIALDLLDMEPLSGVHFIKGDFTEESTLKQLLQFLDGQAADLVISDMAPNLSGMKDIDQPRSMYLVELAVDVSTRILRPGGSLLVKCFEGSGIDEVRRSFRESFQQFNNYKPEASRSRSREVYLLGRGFNNAETDFL